jgi:hypothetical protein
MNALHPTRGAAHLPWAVHKIGKVDAGRVPYQNARDLLGASDTWQPPGSAWIRVMKPLRAGAIGGYGVSCPVCRNYAWHGAYQQPIADALGAAHHPACTTLQDKSGGAAGQLLPGSRTTARHAIPLHAMPFGQLGTSMGELARAQRMEAGAASSSSSSSSGLGWGALAVIGGIGALVLFGDKWLKARGG